MEAAFVEIGLERNGFLYVDEIVAPVARGQAPGQAHPGPAQPRRAHPRAGGQGPDEVEGRAAHDGDLAARPLRRLRPERRGPRRLAPARGRRAPAPEGHPQGAEREEGRRHRPHGGRGRERRGRRARPRLPAEALEDDRGAGEDREGADAHLPGGRAAAARHARPLHGELRARARRRRQDVQAHHRLPQEDVAAHGRARRALQGEGAAARALRRRRGDPLDAQPARRPAVGRLPRSSTTRRRSPSSTSTPAASSARARRRRRRGSRTRSRRTTSRR